MESNSWRTWGAVIVLSAAMFGAVLYLRPELRERFFPSEAETEPAEEVATNEAAPKKKKKKKKRYAAASSATNAIDPENFVDDYEPSDNFAIGNVFDEEEPEEPQAEPEPEFVPPPEMWQPDGPYRPTARWESKNADHTDIVEISMTGGVSQPLSGKQISSVLNERKLMPCYDPVARKVPQMRGRVEFNVAVSGEGKPTKIVVTSSGLRSKTVEQCMVDTIRNLRFPEASGQRHTRFDIDFTFE